MQLGIVLRLSKKCKTEEAELDECTEVVAERENILTEREGGTI